jgi:uncharacterized protein YndB with AHSA1/START domain
MAGCTIEKHIEASPEKVFACATDFRRVPEVVKAITRIEVLTEGPTRLGTRIRETRMMCKREATVEMEVVAYDPPSLIALGCEIHGCRYRTEFRFVPSGSGTDVIMTFDATPLTIMAKLVAFLFRPMMKMMADQCANDLDDVKAACER